MARASTTRATLLLVAAFVAGGLVGGAAMLVADRSEHERRSRDDGRPSYTDVLTTELELSSEQRQAVEMILQRYGPVMDSVWRAVRTGPELTAVRQAIRNEIRAQLTPEQQTRYQAMLDRPAREDGKGGRSGNQR